MVPYQYRPLDVGRKDIRILHLYPGSRDDPIRVSIEHIAFNPSKDDEPLRISKASMRDIQKDLPWDWTVHSTIEGRPIFWCDPGDAPPYASWQSPIPSTSEAHGKDINTARARSFEGAFEAVSYTWGSAQPLTDISIMDAQSPSTWVGTCSVRSNLLDMLIHLRRPEMARALWVDAICINQEDPLEKGEQIRRMYDIFKFASRTVIWLGLASNNSTQALQALEYLGKQLEYSSDNCFLPAPDASEKNWWSLRHLIPLDSLTWSAIADLIQLPYFERLWIMQEIQAAGPNSMIQCGETEIPWYYARRAFIRCFPEMATLPQSSSLTSRRNQHVAEEISRSLAMEDVHVLFSIASGRQCADPKDKVFAILGLLPLSFTRHIQSSYTFSMQDVYIQACLATVNSTCRLGLLDRTNQHEQPNDHPSWAPDFRRSNYELHMVLAGSYAGGSSAAHASFQPPDRLQVRGVSRGKVQAVSPTITSHIAGDYQAVLELVSLNLLQVSKEQILDWYVWIIAQGDLKDRWHNHRMTPSLQEAKAMVQHIRSGEDPCVAPSYRQWYAANLTEQQPGRFFVTDQGQLGCGPPTVAPGDKVFVLAGYDKPVLLRSTYFTVPSTCYHHMGPSYVHGLMEGQGLLGSIPSPWRYTIDVHDDQHRQAVSFLNCETNGISLHDPRLDMLPQEWDEVEEEDDARLVFHTQHYKNKITGEIINSDPRMLPEALEARGVYLETIALV
jgi:hypothetical protein